MAAQAKNDGGLFLEQSIYFEPWEIFLHKLAVLATSGEALSTLVGHGLNATSIQKQIIQRSYPRAMKPRNLLNSLDPYTLHVLK